MKNIVFTFCLILAHFANAQVQWAKQIYSSSTTFGEYCYTVSDGINNYLIGNFGNILYLPGDTIFANGNNDIFIAKFDANGNNLWAKNIGGNSNSTMDVESANAVYDPVNNCIYLSGHFVDNFYFPGVGYITGNSDIFLAKMDLDGNFIWAKKAGGNGYDRAQVYVNPSGKIYMVTQSADSAYFDNFQVGAGGAIAIYDTYGNCLSAEVKYNTNIFTGSNNVNLAFIESDLIYYGSFITDSFSLDTAHFHSYGNYDAFIARADSTGKIKWIKKIQSEGRESISKVLIKNNNDITILGAFSDTLNYLNAFLPISGYDIILSTINENGNLKWVEKFNLNSTTLVAGIDIKNFDTDNTIVTGYMNGSADFGNIQINSNTLQDMFLAKFDTIGTCLSTFNFGIGIGSSVTIDDSGNIYVSGNFSNNVSIGTNNLNMLGISSDIYLAKFDATLGNNTRTAPNNTLVIYANPNNGTCNMTIPDDLKSSPNLTLMIYNAQGSLIQKQQIQQMQDKVKLSLDAEAKGLYNVTLSDSTKMYYGKIVFE